MGPGPVTGLESSLKSGGKTVERDLCRDLTWGLTWVVGKLSGGQVQGRRDHPVRHTCSLKTVPVGYWGPHWGGWSGRTFPVRRVWAPDGRVVGPG